MNIDTAKKIIRKEIGVLHCFKYNGSRNQKEEFYGTIIKAFPAIFIIKLRDGNIRSFSYGDFIINSIKIVS